MSDYYPYIGPVDSYDRYMRGEIVTTNEFITDQSEWVVRVMDERNLGRFRWMVGNIKDRDA